jgi:hypothetical protein
MVQNNKRGRKDYRRNIADLKSAILFKKPVFSKKPRSPKWRKVRSNHLKAFNQCVACGAKTSLEVHHIIPYQLDPSLELDPNNLMTLCESKSRCHWIIGHLLNWRSYNPKAMDDAMAFRLKIINRPVV